MPTRPAVPGSPGDVSEAIREARRLRGLSMRELARRIEVSPATMSAIEAGTVGLNVKRLRRIASELDVLVADLVAGSVRVAKSAHAGDRVGVQSLHEIVPATQGGDWREFAPMPIGSLLSSAVRAMVETGYHGTSMRAIARTAGMSVPGIYHHYRSKQELLVKILDVTMTDLIWRVKAAGDEARDPVTRVSLIVYALALFHTRRKDLAFIGASEMRSLQPENYRRIVALRDLVQHMLDAAIDDATAQNGRRITRVRHAGRAIATMCTALPQWYSPDGPTTPEWIAREYAQFALMLLGLTSPTPISDEPLS